jgi:hypothetical protein
MTAVEMGVDLSSFIQALIAGDKDRLIAVARTHLQQGEQADVLIGRIALLATLGDPDGHITATLGSAAMLSRLVHFVPDPLQPTTIPEERALPILARALFIASPAILADHQKQPTTPEPFFPSGLREGQSVADALHEAIFSNNASLTERLLFGLYGTGADYRTLQVRTYDSIATLFQDGGHPFIFAVRGFQVLDAVEWGNRAPAIIHWLAPRLPLRQNSNEPEWVQPLRSYVGSVIDDVKKIRTRLSLPKNTNALPLRQLIASDADTTAVCQGVYDALIKGEASSKGIASVTALAAADILLHLDESDHELFTHTTHGLLFASAARTAFQQVQDVDALPLLFTSAAYINALHKEIAAHPSKRAAAHTTPHIAGGGLVATSLLETLAEQLDGQDASGALISSHRYLSVGYDPRALFATIALAAAQIDAASDRDHTLQIVQAASDTFLHWPHDLGETNLDSLVQIAIRAALSGPRDPALAQL